MWVFELARLVEATKLFCVLNTWEDILPEHKLK